MQNKYRVSFGNASAKRRIKGDSPAALQCVGAASRQLVLPEARECRDNENDFRKGEVRMFAFYILVAVAAFAVIFLIGVYNHLIALRNRYRNAFSQIDVQLKRRCDLIPNLVETAKGYLKHERETLEAVIQARSAAVNLHAEDTSNPQALKNLLGAESNLTSALTRLLIVAENYPELKADKTMMQLSEELSSTENRVAFSRQAYNDAVTSYNIARETFPNVVVANFMQFGEAPVFEVESDEDRKNPKVSFG